MTLVEAVAQRERSVLIAVLVTVPLLCWAWIVPMSRDMHSSMTGPSAWMMTATWDARHLMLLAAMWAVMMIGMMLPSAAPMLLIYAEVMRRTREGPKAALQVYPMAAGYIAVWLVFSIAATILQRMLSQQLALTPMMEFTTPTGTAVLLVVAAVYQITPAKRVCLAYCRTPIAFISEHLQTGARGAFNLGLAHGWYCLGCCWALMLLLFAGGVMNLTVIAALTVFVILEKVAPLGWAWSWLSAVFLMAIAVWIMTASA